MTWGKKQNNLNNQSGSPKFVKDRTAQTQREQNRKAKEADSKGKKGGKK